MEKIKTPLWAPQYDGAGHDHGFGDDPGYTRAITEVDGRIGSVIASIEERVRSSGERWLILVTSDHGGHTTSSGKGNHSRQPEDQRILFIVSGVPPLSLAPLRLPVTQMDVFPTVLAWLGVEHDPVDGRAQGTRPWSESARASDTETAR